VAICELVVKGDDRSIRCLFGHFATLPLALEVKLQSACDSHDGSPAQISGKFPFGVDRCLA
jgi:hypothetical protein